MSEASQDLAREVGTALTDTFGPHIAMDGMVLAMHALGEIRQRPALLRQWLIESGFIDQPSEDDDGISWSPYLLLGEDGISTAEMMAFGSAPESIARFAIPLYTVLGS